MPKCGTRQGRERYSKTHWTKLGTLAAALRNTFTLLGLQPPADELVKEARLTELQVRPAALIFSQSMMGYGAAMVRAMGPSLSSIWNRLRISPNILQQTHAHTAAVSRGDRVDWKKHTRARARGQPHFTTTGPSHPSWCPRPHISRALQSASRSIPVFR